MRMRLRHPLWRLLYQRPSVLAAGILVIIIGLSMIMLAMSLWLFARLPVLERRAVPGTSQIEPQPSSVSRRGGGDQAGPVFTPFAGRAAPQPVAAPLPHLDPGILAEVLWLECRNQTGSAACLTKGYVFLHRLDLGWAPSWWEVLARGSVLADGTDVWPGMSLEVSHDPHYQRLYTVAEAVTGRKIADPCPDAVYYMDGNSVPPGPERDPLCVIGGSRFYGL